MDVDSLGSTPDGFVKLRVGGTVFEASEDTLRSEKGSLFDAMLNGPWRNKCDSSGAIVFDRDPKRFRALLNFLRTRALVLEDGVTAEGVRLEAEYFQVEDAVTAAEKLQTESEVPSLLRLVVDSRKGKLLLVSEDQPSIFPADLAIDLQSDSLITLDATFTSVVGLRPEVLLVSNGKVESLISHVQDSGRSIRAIGRVQPGCYQLQLVFHVVPEESNDSIRSPHKKDHGHAHGPARLEVWRYPNNDKVRWTESFNVSNPERNVRPLMLIPSLVVDAQRQIDMWLCGEGNEDASALAQAVGAISSSVYN